MGQGFSILQDQAFRLTALDCREPKRRSSVLVGALGVLTLSPCFSLELSHYDRSQAKIEPCGNLVANEVGCTSRRSATRGIRSLQPHTIAQKKVRGGTHLMIESNCGVPGVVA